MSQVRYRFIPTLPTKVAWDNRAFKHDFIDDTSFFDALTNKEISLGKFNYLSGYIHFREGAHSTYKDGSEPQPRPNPRWWKTGARSCHKGCCTQIPKGETYENTEPATILPKPYYRRWQEFRRITGMGGFIEQMKLIEDKTTLATIQLKDLGSFFVEPY